MLPLKSNYIFSITQWACLKSERYVNGETSRNFKSPWRKLKLCEIALYVKCQSQLIFGKYMTSGCPTCFGIMCSSWNFYKIALYVKCQSQLIFSKYMTSGCPTCFGITCLSWNFYKLNRTEKIMCKITK